MSSKPQSSNSTTGTACCPWRGAAAVAIIAVMAVYLVSWTFAFGGWTFFSPQTLECYSQTEILLPFTEIPLYRSPLETHRYRLVRFLIDHGYWTPQEATEEPIPVQHWNHMWRDGHADIVRQFSWHADRWIEWTQENETFAAELWPQVLHLLRSDGRQGEELASYLMQSARMARSRDEFEGLVAEMPKLQSALAEMETPADESD